MKKCRLLLPFFALAAVGLPAQTTGTALVRHAPSINGNIDGSVRQMLPESVTLNGGASVTGDFLLPGLPTVRLNGNPSYFGTLDGTGAATPTSHQVTLNGNVSLRRVVRRTDALALPAVSAPPLPAGTRSVSINSSSQSPGNFATLRNLTLNGNVGQFPIAAGTYGNFTANGGSGFTLGVVGATQPTVYRFQSLTLNGNSALHLVGPVIITLASSMAANGQMGVSTNPEWLSLRIASGGLTLNGSVSIYGYVEAPAGTVTLNGSARLIGGVASDRLTLNGNSFLRLIAQNNPPAVVVTAPVNGAVFVAPAPIVISANATDLDGAVAKVEFFQGTTKLGEDTVAPYTFTRTGAQPGSYTLTARATDNLGATSLDSAPVTVVVSAPAPANILPVLAGFEAAEGYVLGSLHGQQGWTATGTAVVTEADAATGERSALVPAATPPLALARNFDPHPTQSVVFVDWWALPQAAASEADAARFSTFDAMQVAFVRNGESARVAAFDGDGAGGGGWKTVCAGLPVDSAGYATDWLRLTARIDFTARKWDLFVNGALVAVDLGFGQNSAATLRSFTLLGQAGAPTLLDDFLAGFDNPLFTDADKDGMDDAWEIAHGLNPALNDRNGDPDGDGLTNIVEFLFGSKPNLADSDGDGLTDAQERALGTNPNAPDTDGDGLPDGWEVSQSLDPRSAADANLDLDGDGLTNLQEYQQGKNPRDYFNGVQPQVTSLVGPNGELGPGGTLRVRLTNASGQPFANAPVTFVVQVGGHQLSTTPSGPMVNEVQVRTGIDGVAKAYVRGGSN